MVCCYPYFLTSKEKRRYIDEDQPDPTNNAWAKDDAQVRSWRLANSIEQMLAVM